MQSDGGRWLKDTVTSGQILLVDHGGTLDIIYTGARKQITSIEVDGNSPGFRLILVIYQGTGAIGHYLFKLDKDGCRYGGLGDYLGLWTTAEKRPL